MHSTKDGLDTESCTTVSMKQRVLTIQIGIAAINISPTKTRPSIGDTCLRLCKTKLSSGGIIAPTITKIKTITTETIKLEGKPVGFIRENADTKDAARSRKRQIFIAL